MTIDLKQLSNESLQGGIRKLVAEERRLSTEILHHLHEISRRRLHAELGYSSLWEYCVKELRYSEGAAQRRISAMRAMAEIPEIENLIKEGKLSLSSVAQVQSFCQMQKKQKPEAVTIESKRDLFKAVEGKSRRQTEQLLSAIAPQAIPAERERVLTPNETEVRFVADRVLLEKLHRIKELSPDSSSYAEIFAKMAEIVLDKIDPKRKVMRKERVGKKTQMVDRVGVVSPPPAEVKPELRAIQSARYISAGVRAAVFKRDQFQCTFVNSQTRYKCGETRSLEIDHIFPFALGGSNDLENLRLYCRAHNRLAAIQTYGVGKLLRPGNH